MPYAAPGTPSSEPDLAYAAYEGGKYLTAFEEATRRVNEKGDPNYGFDAQSGDYKDMVGAGIVDPAKVVRVALQDAASVAGLLITTEAMVTDRPEPKAGAMPHDHGHGMGGMDF